MPFQLDGHARMEMLTPGPSKETPWSIPNAAIRNFNSRRSRNTRYLRPSAKKDLTYNTIPIRVTLKLYRRKSGLRLNSL